MNVILSRVRLRLSQQRFPHIAEHLQKTDLFTGWWYYSVELVDLDTTQQHTLPEERHLI